MLEALAERVKALKALSLRSDRSLPKDATEQALGMIVAQGGPIPVYVPAQRLSAALDRVSPGDIQQVMKNARRVGDDVAIPLKTYFVRLHPRVGDVALSRRRRGR